MNRHYLNRTGFNKLAQSIKDYINRKITGYNKLGTASTKDFTTYVSPTQTDQLPISSSVYSAMTNMLRGAYHPAGSKTVAELTSDLLVKANLGNVYKITEDGVTSDLFIGGAGQTIKTGDNAIVLYASEDTYKFSLESGVVDLDAYQKKELTSGALIEDVIPSDASASNKLATHTAIEVSSSDTITTLLSKVKVNQIANVNTRVSAFNVSGISISYLLGTLEKFSNGGLQFKGVAKDASNNMYDAVLWFNDATVIIANPQYSYIIAIPTSTVTQGSTAPITSGGVFTNTVCRKGVGVSNANSIKENGIFFISPNWSNVPSGVSYGTLIMFFNTNNEGVQVCFGSTADKSSKMYFRTFAANIWTTWVSVTGV